MEDHKKDEPLQKYRTARSEYRTIAINQLSFANNLLLTLAVGFMTLGVNRDDFETLSFHPRDSFSFEKLFLVLYVGSMSISIFWGILVMFSRLYDFRLTRYILSVRVTIFQKYGETLGYKVLAKTTKKDRWRSFCLNWTNSVKRFTQEDINRYEQNKENFKKEFIDLRKIAMGLGDASIRWTQVQAIFLMIGVLAFLMYLLAVG